jgi:hypothetical protein
VCFSHVTLLVDQDTTSLNRVAYDEDFGDNCIPGFNEVTYPLYPGTGAMTISFASLRSSSDWQFQNSNYYNIQPVHFNGYSAVGFDQYLQGEFANNLYSTQSSFADGPPLTVTYVSPTLAHVDTQIVKMVSLSEGISIGLDVSFDMVINSIWGCVYDAGHGGIYNENTDTSVSTATPTSSLLNGLLDVVEALTVSLIDIGAIIQNDATTSLSQTTVELGGTGDSYYFLFRKSSSGNSAGLQYATGLSPSATPNQYCPFYAQ